MEDIFREAPTRQEIHLRVAKRKAVEIAKDFLYGDEVVEKLKQAKTEIEIDRILITARKNKTRIEDAQNDMDVMRTIKKEKNKKR